MKIEKIRRLITANHGGFDNATGAEIMAVWRSLPDETKKLYETKDKDKEKTNANISKP